MDQNTQSSQKDPGSPVTVVVVHQVKPGCENRFEQSLAEITRAATSFPGHMGVTIIRSDNQGTLEYRIIFRFDTKKHLHEWEDSKIRRDWTVRCREFTRSGPIVQHTTGLETWFTVQGAEIIRPPPRYKMVLVTWIAIFPLISILLGALGPVLEPFPLPLRALLITGITVISLTYGIMPIMGRIFAFWLYPHTK